MRIPRGRTEKEVLTAIEKVVRMLAPSFVFGCFEVEDIRQQGRLFALECLARYDESRPLENFLYSHVKNRLINFKRDKFRRTDAPCKVCAQAGHEHEAHPWGYCEVHLAWVKRQDAKACLARSSGVGEVASASSREGGTSELAKLVDDELEVGLRGVYLRVMAGVAVSLEEREELRTEVRRILNAGKADGQVGEVCSLGGGEHPQVGGGETANRGDGEGAGPECEQHQEVDGQEPRD